MRSHQQSAFVFDPVATTLPDGSLSVDWPADESPLCLISREILLDLVEQANEGRRHQRSAPA